MAANSHHTRAGSRTSIGPGDQDLPNGSCNYRDLSIGSRAPICGCTRFWLNTAHFNINDGQSERAWCFCGHHACFHNAFSQQLEEREQMSAPDRTEDVHERAQGMTGDTRTWPAYNYSTPSKNLTGLGIQPGSRSQSQSINTRVFQALNDFARNQEDVDSITSKLPSTNAPSLIEEPRYSVESHLAQDRQQQLRSMAPPVNIPTIPAPRQAEEYSATEVATPSIAGTPDFRALASSSSGNRPSPGHLNPSRLGQIQPRLEPPPPAPRQLASVDRVASTIPTGVPLSALEFQNILQMYGQRLDVLENLSFSQVPVEELQERFEHFDGRILDLEHWRVDQEQVQPSPDPAKASSSSHRRLLPTETGSFGSDASFDSNAAIAAEASVLATLAANAETRPRIDALESRVNDLENAAPPSFGRPWHVQVVLLPWGRDLRGIWFSALEATQRSMKSATQNSEEWSGAQSGPKLSFKSPTSGAWTTESIQAWASEAQEWLSPKACGPSGAVFQRLASRGLVRDVSLTAPDARHILNAVDEAFRDFAGDFDEDIAESDQIKRFQGLGVPFIPLRKIRKSARLRFLSQAEMVSSAAWTASFLDSSVFMKVSDGQRRLYVTTPDAYLQSNVDSAWTWKTIRDLPIFDASEGEAAAQLEKIAVEACWTYNDRLDQLISLHSSFASHESQWSTRSQFAIDEPDSQDQRPISPSSSNLRPQRQRTVSLPESNVVVSQAKEALPKRRVTSFEPIVSASNYTDECGIEVASKRRRISMSPELDRRGVNFTPRWSREPPSPFTSEVATGEARSQGAASVGRKRGTTPFAYATPHSNVNFVGRVDLGAGDGDTEVATDIVGMSERGAEEEWEGMDDDHGHDIASDGGSVVQAGAEADVDDEPEDMEDGMELYEG